MSAGLGIDFCSTCWRWRARGSTAPGLKHCSVRHADIYDLQLPPDSFDVVIVHQVLHFLDDGAPCGRRRRRTRCRPQGGCVDRRLRAARSGVLCATNMRIAGSAFRIREVVTQWLEQAGLDVVRFDNLPPEQNSEGKDRGVALAGARPAHCAGGDRLEVAC